jgi:hypothetical protein
MRRIERQHNLRSDGFVARTGCSTAEERQQTCQRRIQRNRNKGTEPTATFSVYRKGISSGRPALARSCRTRALLWAAAGHRAPRRTRPPTLGLRHLPFVSEMRKSRRCGSAPTCLQLSPKAHVRLSPSATRLHPWALESSSQSRVVGHHS